MLRFALSEFIRKNDHRACNKLIDQVLSIQQEHGSRAANQVFLDNVGLILDGTRNEEYYQEALCYHLALMQAYLDKPKKTARLMKGSHTLPAAGGNIPFSDHVQGSLELAKKQDEAFGRGMPSLLIASMPRAASATLTQTLAQIYKMPVLRLSIGDFPHNVLVPSWVNTFTRGGALTHDHFGASGFNLKVLKNCNVRDVFVLVRDPRAAAASMALFAERERDRDPSIPPRENRFLKSCKEFHIPWVCDWMACAQKSPKDMRVHWILSTDVRMRMDKVLQNICDVLEPLYPEFAKIDGTPIPEIKANFVSGDDDAWRKEYSEEVQQEVWDSIPPEIARLLNLKP